MEAFAIRGQLDSSVPDIQSGQQRLFHFANGKPSIDPDEKVEPDEGKLAVKLEITAAGVNVAAPEEDLGQDYFVVKKSDDLWVDGYAVQKDPRRVRQFVTLNPGTG